MEGRQGKERKEGEGNLRWKEGRKEGGKVGN